MGNILPLSFASFTGTWTYSVNGGAPQTLTFINSGAAGGELSASDMYVGGDLSSFAVGDKITLNAATITTTTNVAAAKPRDGAYATFVFDGNGTRISSNGVSAAVVPEANSAALLGLALPIIGTVAVARRKKKA
ncbi:MAG: hypothetical protein EON58_17310 [Alphaproteobacteria bacterium]|nr:MAG: hypothetical protein EON58_17310 [Alphaproteobacteria bacterium]